MLTDLEPIIFMTDSEHQPSISECSSVSRHKKIDRELCLNENMPPSSKCEGNGKKHHLGEADMPILSLAKLEGRSLNKKSVKKPNIFSCSKRPRIDQPENSVTNSGIDEHNILSRTIGSDSIQCTSAGNKDTTFGFTFLMVSTSAFLSIIR